MNPLLIVILLTLVPGLELRASIPYGIFAGLSWPVVFAVAVITNIILGIVTYVLLSTMIKLFCKIKFFNILWNKYIKRLQEKSSAKIEKYGAMGLAIFIAIPLPGTGVISGAAVAEIFGIKFKKFLLPMIIGVVIAGVIVTMVSLLGVEAFRIFIKT